MTDAQAIVAQAIADLLGAVGKKQHDAEPTSAIEALTQLEKHAFDAAVGAVITFAQIRMMRVATEGQK
ncbi:MAG TPA: hypothetical protein VHB79_10380 [Polyangiaceae bacterium]|nr:hypothetical protein [Polyangiaceae bacterium]